MLKYMLGRLFIDTSYLPFEVKMNSLPSFSSQFLLNTFEISSLIDFYYQQFKENLHGSIQKLNGFLTQ